MSEESERLEGRVIKGEAVTLGHKSRVSVVEDCTFQGCEITISCSAAGLVLIDSTFLGCTLRFTKRFSNHQFFDTTFERCEFIGRFSGCEFGFRDIEMSPRRGTIVDCTFTHAELDFVSFNSADMSRITLPPWPQFAILSPEAYGNVPALAEEPTWRGLRAMPWWPEQAALVQLYRVGGSYGYTLPADVAKEALRQASGVRVERAAA